MKSKLLSLDIISTLPETIIETILCLLPIEDAATTSILSREWRYKWTKIPKLLFDEYTTSTDKTYQLSPRGKPVHIPCEWKERTRRSRLFFAIYQVLLMHQGPISDFTLSVDANEICAEINQILHHLSKNNTLKNLTLQFSYCDDNISRVPISLSSLHHLTDLCLTYCVVKHLPTFNGFHSLTTLYLEDVDMSMEMLLHLLSNCPLLKSFTLRIDPSNVLDAYDTTIFEIFKCLPLIEHLTMSSSVIQCFVKDAVPQELPTSLLHLKCFCMTEMCLNDENNYGLPFLMLLIRCSPNLEKINIEIFQALATDPYLLEESKDDLLTIDQDYSDIQLDQNYSDIRLEHLKELRIKGFIDFKLHLEFGKLILVKSPLLEKVHIWLQNKVTKEEESNLSRILLSSPRASPIVKIIVER